MAELAIMSGVPTLAFVIQAVLHRRYTDRFDSKLQQLGAMIHASFANLEAQFDSYELYAQRQGRGER